MLILNDEQRMIREAAGDFFRERAPVSQLRALRDADPDGGFSQAVWREMAQMGFAGVLVPQEYGGVDLGYVAAGVILEEMGRNLSRSPFLITAIMGATALLAGGTQAQKAAILPGLATGDLLLALAMDEVARHCPAQISTRLVRAGGGYRLDGMKRFVFDAHVADYLIVSARSAGADDAQEGISLVLVPRDAPGVSITSRRLVDDHRVAQVVFEDVAVEDADLLGQSGACWPLLEQILDAGRVCLAAEMLGIAEQSFAMTLDYLRQREQFGVRIGSFQALQHRAAHLHCEIELARSVVLRALQAFDGEDGERALLASVAKSKAGEVACLATAEAIQMHGGIGMTDEFDLGFYLKRARVANECWGDQAFHGDRMATIRGY